MALITGSTTTDWSTVNVGALFDVETQFNTFFSRFEQISADIAAGYFIVNSATSTSVSITLLPPSANAGATLVAKGSQFFGRNVDPIINSFVFNNPSTGELLRFSGTLDGVGNEVVKSFTIGVPSFQFTMLGQIVVNQAGGVVSGRITELRGTFGSTTVTIRGTLVADVDFNLSGTVTQIAIMSGTDTIMMRSLSIPYSALSTITTVSELFSVVGAQMTGNDTIIYTNNSAAGMSFLSGPGNDVITIGGPNGDTLGGGSGDDVLDGGAGDDAILGGDGNDAVVIRNAADHGSGEVIAGGAGDDTIRFASVVPGQTLVLASGVTEIESVVIGTAAGVTTGKTALNVDASAVSNGLSITGNAGDNVLTGTDLDDVLVGNAGHDTLNGGAGRDRLIGGPGNDTLSGGPGDDTYVIGQGTDVLVEEPGAGTDLVESSITHALGPNFENLTLTGTKPINGTGNELNNVIIGNGAANVLEGGAGNDTLIGNGGNDRLDGGVGDDAMEGGAGNDTYIVDSLGDTVTESLAGAAGGIDLVLSAVDFTLGPNVEHLTLTGTADLAGTGNELNNILIGNSGNNVLEGGAGTDTLSGGAGDDTLDGGAGRDRLIGGAGDDTYLVDLVRAGEGVAATVKLEDTITEGRNQGTDQVILRGIVSDLMRATTLTLGANLERLDAGSTADTKLNLTGNALDNELIGNGADNLLIGLAGNDRLDGRVGNDVLIGGQGNDVLIGGAGSDTYVFGRGDGQDVIQDTDGAADKVLFGRGTAPVDVILSRQADDLRLALRRTSDQVTIRDWYVGAANQVETIETGTRHLLLHTQVESLIQAMVQFTTDTGLSWEAAAAGAGTGGQQAQFQAILAAHWTGAGSEGA
ncbi:calcium-binding protein [Candidatus Nitrospira inopinata]|jgi:Ca2+-binding RTX toxin-like protein|uniref:Haemolysin-type calcium binding-related domain-containing protein n=1 Tax=Candidatus Nitrospira inopinata TaxID=1715989 RepID=A0A0S4KVM6_9BACT|nr:calcium-binding protein [Candidatus Nitrospira inopinata]CUQ68181.1 protein of unknown function [Candidatus Nitrospira inopinata]